VALLLRDRDATSDVAAEPPGDGAAATVADSACEACGARMKPGQDWCLECGAAAPGRLGARPGWRAAFTVVALTLLLVAGAVVASYAALTTDAERKAAAPSSGSGAPIAAQPPAAVPPAPAAVAPIAPGATGPGTVPPAVAPAPAPGAAVGPIIPTTPPAPATNVPVAPPAGAQAPPAATQAPPVVAKPPPPANAKPAAPPAPKPVIISLKDDAASTYDPAKRAGAEFGPAANAIDKSPKSVWDVSVPADGKPIGAGLLIDLGKPYALRALRLATPTPGFHIEVYGAVSAKETPEDILDKRWEHLTDVKQATDGKLVSLLGKSKDKLQLLMLYVTVPADASDPRAAIANVTLAGTP
jgi:hypothetical protein